MGMRNHPASPCARTCARSHAIHHSGSLERTGYRGMNMKIMVVRGSASRVSGPSARLNVVGFAGCTYCPSMSRQCCRLPRWARKPSSSSGATARSLASPASWRRPTPAHAPRAASRRIQTIERGAQGRRGRPRLSVISKGTQPRKASGSRLHFCGMIQLGSCTATSSRRISSSRTIVSA